MKASVAFTPGSTTRFGAEPASTPFELRLKQLIGRMDVTSPRFMSSNRSGRSAYDDMPGAATGSPLMTPATSTLKGERITPFQASPIRSGYYTSSLNNSEVAPSTDARDTYPTPSISSPIGFEDSARKYKAKDLTAQLRMKDDMIQSLHGDLKARSSISSKAISAAERVWSAQLGERDATIAAQKTEIHQLKLRIVELEGALQKEQSYNEFLVHKHEVEKSLPSSEADPSTSRKEDEDGEPMSFHKEE
jgi:hypothetical protein